MLRFSPPDRRSREEISENARKRAEAEAKKERERMRRV
jgi:hypothetical protein